MTTIIVALLVADIAFVALLCRAPPSRSRMAMLEGHEVLITNKSETDARQVANDILAEQRAQGFALYISSADDVNFSVVRYPATILEAC